MARYIVKRLEDSAGGGALDMLQATLNHADAKLDMVDAKIERNSRDILRLCGLAIGVAGLGTLAAMSSCVALVTQRAAPAAPVASAPTPTPTPAPMHDVIVNIRPAGVEVEASEMVQRQRAFAEYHHLGTFSFGTGEMGEKVPPERWVPQRPLPWQKLPPCQASYGEKEINGACWAGPFEDIKPPCGELFRSGDKCYRPVAADPQKPVGFKPEADGQKPR